jgi:hypothetical protein
VRAVSWAAARAPDHWEMHRCSTGVTTRREVDAPETTLGDPLGFYLETHPGFYQHFTRYKHWGRLTKCYLVGTG